MLRQELKLTKDIEIKFCRLSSPSLTISDLPLSGLYQAFSENNIFNFQKTISPLGRGGQIIFLHLEQVSARFFYMKN